MSRAALVVAVFALAPACGSRPAPHEPLANHSTAPAGPTSLDVVVRSETNEPLAGVTLLVTSATNADLEAITNERGEATLGEVPAGRAVVTFYYADITVERHIDLLGPTHLAPQIPTNTSGGVVLVCTGDALATCHAKSP